MTEINDESSSSLITVEENEAETVPYDTFVENEALNIDISFEDNLISEEGDASTMGIICSFHNISNMEFFKNCKIYYLRCCNIL